ncbi:ganglioside GM2 activator-like [Mizuhopecten yessoensis]|uniref:ganglioside GM2 activator-like n=1 Tax=Mizuhopecten yessoensis TaxID=6573 RepID=UPI000B45A0E1|nr:ganglioside GM2 activator-like [Mizuhopecten yessoensis]
MNMLYCFAICVVLPLVIADTLKFHPRARGQGSSKMMTGDLAFLEKLLVGSHKATMLKDFVFKNCGGNTGSVFNLTITPDPIRFPGTLTISATVDLKQEISAPLTVVLDMKKDFRGDWIDIPCIANVGSCTYSSLCSDLDMATCPEELKNAGIDCRCPFKAKTYKVSSLSIPVNAAAFLSGDFKVKALVTFGDGGKYSQCIDVQFSVA